MFYLNKGENISGELLAIEENLLIVNSSYGVLKMGLNEVAQIQFADAKKVPNNTVSITLLRNQDKIHGIPTAFKDKTFHIRTDFGEVIITTPTVLANIILGQTKDGSKNNAGQIRPPFDENINWILNPDNEHYYYRGNTPMTWGQAKAYCVTLGGHLATITSEEENRFLYQTFKSTEDKKCWLGGTDEQKEGFWEWITGESWGYTNWEAAEPNNWGGKQHYLQFFWFDNGKWDDKETQESYTDNDKGKTYHWYPLCEWE